MRNKNEKMLAKKSKMCYYNSVKKNTQKEEINVKWDKKDVELIKRTIDRLNGRIDMQADSKHCVEALEADTECLVIRSKYPGEKISTLLRVIKEAIICFYRVLYRVIGGN